MTEIEECQKCGGEGQLNCGLNDMYDVICEDCDNRTLNEYKKFEDAINEWNMRA